MDRGETITENTAAMARKAALEGIWEQSGRVLYEDLAPHFIELFRAVAETKRPAMVLYKDEWLTCLVPAADVIDVDRHQSKERGVAPIMFEGMVVDAYEAIETDPEDGRDSDFDAFAQATLEGYFAFFSVGDPGIPEVVMSNVQIIDELAEFSRASADLEAERRVRESRDDPSFLVPLPDELVEGLDLTADTNGVTIVPRGHIAFVVEYERLKDEAVSDETGRKQAELDALVESVRQLLVGELEGEPFNLGD